MLRFGLLGAGRIGQVHGMNIATNPRAKLVAIYDPFEDAANKLAAETGAQVRDMDKIIKGKATGEQWLDVAREAHKLGIPSNCTMLYGHIETIEDRVDHLIRLRELQDETNGFVTFIPLAFQPWEAPNMKLPETTGFEDLKAIAVARLMLDNIPHIKSYWIMIGPRVAQIGLSFGADDLDGTVTEEKVAHDAGAPTSQSLSVDELCRLIREAGRRPVERDTVFNAIREW